MAATQISIAGRPVMAETLSRHWSVFREAWLLDRAESRTRQRYRETEFLPAALEIIETPASPLGRMLLWSLIGLLGVALVWSIFGRLDVVAVAPGRVVPDGRVKIIQPSELGVVRAIHVRDGQTVKRGQLLIELDPTMAGADDAQASRGLMVASIDSARAQALLAHANGGDGRFVAPPGTPPDIAAAQAALVRSQIAEYDSKRGTLIQERAERTAERMAALAEREKMKETLPLLEKQVEARRTLVAKGFGAKLQLLQIEEELIERKRNLEIQTAGAMRAAAAIAGIDQKLGQLRAEFMREAAGKRVEAADNIALRTEELTKTHRRQALQLLAAPVDGTVQQLAVHTLGGVVQPAEQLMVIVPNKGGIHVEAKVLNKDIGFVRAGQPVRIKVEAFPFTEHGIVEGRVAHVGRDSQTDETLGLVYPITVTIDPQATEGGLANRIVPGMAVQAEALTDRRRVIQYLLSPIERVVTTAGREH